jgi:hypothetical protein
MAIANYISQYQKREQMAASRKDRRVETVLTRDEVNKRLASNPTGYISWPLPNLKSGSK